MRSVIGTAAGLAVAFAAGGWYFAGKKEFLAPPGPRQGWGTLPY